MSWFTRSIANTFQLDLNDDDNNSEQHSPYNNIPTDKKPQQQQLEQQEDDSSSSSPSSPTRGIQEDLSEITKTLTRQLWGIASFITPPPPPDPNNHQSDPEDAAPEGILGIRNVSGWLTAE
ncbi:hypothetical protein Hanom_Chr09g00859391 [Helianthus anomalus]